MASLFPVCKSLQECIMLECLEQLTDFYVSEVSYSQNFLVEIFDLSLDDFWHVLSVRVRHILSYLDHDVFTFFPGYLSKSVFLNFDLSFLILTILLLLTLLLALNVTVDSIGSVGCNDKDEEECECQPGLRNCDVVFREGCKS